MLNPQHDAALQRCEPFALMETIDPLLSTDASAVAPTHQKSNANVAVAGHRLAGCLPSTSKIADAPGPGALGNPKNNGSDTDVDAVEALRAIAYMLGSPVQRRQHGERRGCAGATGGNDRDDGDDAVRALIALLEMGVNANRIVSLVNER